jgi:tetratricopeptide (TPR) repeat protein
MIRMLFAFTFLFSVFTSTFGQTAKEADELFFEGKSLAENSNYEAAIEKFKQAAEIDNALGTSRKLYLGSDYGLMGLCYFQLNQYDQAIEFFQKALFTVEGTGKKDLIAIILFNTGLVYKTWGKFEKALEYYQKALTIDEELGQKNRIALDLSNIGMAYDAWKKYDKALEYYKKALVIQEEIGQKDNIAMSLSNIAMAYHLNGQYDKAFEYFNKALAIHEQLGHKIFIAIDLSNIGSVYKIWGQYDRAIVYYKKALSIQEELSEKSDIAIELNNIGQVYYSWGQYDNALEYYKKALVIDEYLGNKNSIAFELDSIGMVYCSWGQYDKALEYYKKALAINEELGQKGGVVLNFSGIGQVYYFWGQYDKALEYYQKALAIQEELGQKSGIAIILSYIGSVNDIRGQHDKALEYYTKALALHQELGEKVVIVKDLNNIGSVYYSIKQYDHAIEYYKKALAIAVDMGNKGDIAIINNNIGTVYNSWKQYDKGLEYLRKALAIDEEIGRKDVIATDLNNIGGSYWNLNDYTKAADYLIKSIALKEELRLTATGAVRRDFLASQIHTYQWLVSTYIRDNKPYQAFDIIELSSSKYLIEEMGKKLNEKSFKFTGIKNYQKKIDDNTAIINYANLNLIAGTVQIAVNKDTIFAIEVKSDELVANINKKYKSSIDSAMEKLRGIKIVRKEANEEQKVSEDDFDKIINYYRLLLSRPELSPAKKESMEYISRQLYNFLFAGIEKQLAGKTELVIIPSGILAFLPFETLIMPDGRYLVEKYNIKYCQSLTVNEMIDQRQYSTVRKTFLGFGGAVYDEIQYKTDMLVSEKQLENLQNETLALLSRGASTRNSYSTLGLANWSNLPGTLSEVMAIKSIFKDSEIYTGEAVDESKIKSMSKSGFLKNYRVIHFATHGIVVPEIPELSALVLSIFKNEKNEEDGYLTMNEIAELDINADFVNLSACETGLGKIYGGEGVVGLTQAFLIAGANGLSVSLWQVADESTMKFMLGVYKLVQEKGLSYDQAMTRMKRAFIAGSVGREKYDEEKGALPATEADLRNKKPDRYSAPFYWAPFVYYGK